MLSDRALSLDVRDLPRDHATSGPYLKGISCIALSDVAYLRAGAAVRAARVLLGATRIAA